MMKAIILNVLILFIGCSVSQAQFSEDVEETTNNKFFVGGSFNYDKSENRNSPLILNDILIVGGTTDGSSENSTYSLSPTVGYQLNEHWLLGLTLTFTSSNFERGSLPDNFQTQESSSNSLGVFARYIFNPGNKFQVFANPYLRRSTQETNFAFSSSSIDQFTFEQSSISLGVSLGAQYQFADWIRATTNIGGFYHTTGNSKESNNQEIDFKSTGLNIRASSIFFGVEFLF